MLALALSMNEAGQGDTGSVLIGTLLLLCALVPFLGGAILLFRERLFEEDALEPAPDCEWQVYKIYGPYENSSAETAIPTKYEPESEIEQVVKHCDSENEEPPRESDNHDNVHFPDPGKELESENEPAWKHSIFLIRLLNATLGAFFDERLTSAINLLPIERDVADGKPVLSVTLCTHDLASRVLVVDPLIGAVVVSAVANWLPADIIFVLMGELRAVVLHLEVLTSRSGALHEHGVHGSCQS